MVFDSHQPLVFVGLGNPDSKYAKTRHNIGFMVVEQLAQTLGWKWEQVSYFKVKLTKGIYSEKEIHLVLPMSYMNQSGAAIKQYLDYYKIPINQLIVVCDDTALDFGRLRLRRQGSAGGHNGLKSIIELLNTKEFVRLRMGISRQPVEQSLADYVLSNFTANEANALEEFVKRGESILKSLMTEPIAKVMNKVNPKLTL